MWEGEYKNFRSSEKKWKNIRGQSLKNVREFANESKKTGNYNFIWGLPCLSIPPDESDPSRQKFSDNCRKMKRLTYMHYVNYLSCTGSPMTVDWDRFMSLRSPTTRWNDLDAKKWLWLAGELALHVSFGWPLSVCLSKSRKGNKSLSYLRGTSPKVLC